MDRREAAALDNYITGRWGEDQFDDTRSDDADDDIEPMPRPAPTTDRAFVPAPVSWAIQRKLEQLRQREQHGPA